MSRIDSLLDEVASEAGLDDFGHRSFRDGLEVLDANIGFARLTPIGDAVYEGMVRQSLANRLRVTDWLRQNPDAAGVDPDVSVIIVGLARSGTTALSHLLGADPANRSLLGWEANESIPPPTAAGYSDDPRFVAARASESFVDQINPRFKALHNDEAHEPVECAVPLAQHFASLSITTMLNVEPYDEWLFSADLTHAYDWHRQVLQVLQSDCPGVWQLKSPIHAYAIETVAARYPNAVFVQTHRDPTRCIASTLSLVESLTGTFTEHDFRSYIASHWVETLTMMLERIMNYRSSGGDSRFFDVSYQDLVSDPVAVVAGIYERAGRPFSTDSERAVRAHAEREVQHKFGRHEYSLADFGLERGPIDERVGAYRDHFAIPNESA